MLNYHEDGSASKTIGVEIEDGAECIPVTVTVNENGSVKTEIPEKYRNGRLSQIQLWGIQDAIESDSEIQDEIGEREYQYSLEHRSRSEEVQDDYFYGVQAVRR